MTEIDAIIRAASHVTPYSHADILSTCRHKELTRVRAAITFVGRESGHTYQAIGTALQRDNATVIHYVQHLRGDQYAQRVAVSIREDVAAKLANRETRMPTDIETIVNAACHHGRMTKSTLKGRSLRDEPFAYKRAVCIVASQHDIPKHIIADALGYTKVTRVTQNLEPPFDFNVSNAIQGIRDLLKACSSIPPYVERLYGDPLPEKLVVPENWPPSLKDDDAPVCSDAWWASNNARFVAAMESSGERPISRNYRG